ncbi:hypothetical protein MMC07_001441 [Pseudocyphellaria aurata]|nr:hypothetical protein [Pseudocyphellaria aurata]
MSSFRSSTITADPASNLSVILFGPQYPKFSQADLSELRESLLGNSNLKPLVDTLTELPSLWPTLQDYYPDLGRVQGAEQLQRLGSFLESGTFSSIEALNNIILAPLTVISHFLEYSRLAEEVHNPTSAAEIGSSDVQGFCVGFLAAAAIAGSRDSVELQKHSSTALRLAVCIGAIIDLDEATHPDPVERSSAYAVRWKTDSEQARLYEILDSYPSVSCVSDGYLQAYISCFTDKHRATVTISSHDANSFVLRVVELGLSTRPVGLHGRFHHIGHKNAAEKLKALCKNDPRFQLPTADRLVLPLRSNADAELIVEGALHDIAIDTILTQQSRWFQTVQATVSKSIDAKVNLKAVGDGVIPRSVTVESDREPDISNLENGDSPKPYPSHQPHLPAIGSVLSNPPEKNAIVLSSEIAVIGIACRFPEADSVEEFWNLISTGKSCVSEMPKERFNPSELWRDPKGPFWGNFLRDPDVFDHRFFGISGREAKSMDPQQRLLLQVAYEALESSGYFGLQSKNPPDDIGCYVGVGSVDYGDNVASQNATAFSALGTLRAFISGRLSHYFGWSGPSLTFDTACSSSAVAIHSACKALQLNECSMALAGGVHVMTSPALHQNLAAASFLNSNGASRAFDANAGGYCRGEGAGLILLKPLRRAIADGDSIRAVIAGSAVNQGSNCTPITVPVSKSQTSLYRQVLRASVTDPSEVSYVEAHGTGTPVGDPIEAESIRQTFAGPHRTQELFLGSVKDNIGHAEGASGVAGVLKTILMMENRIIPPQANFSVLNPRIPSLEQDRMAISTRSQKWNSQKLAAVVNNYGAAGSNAAILLKEYCLPGVEIVGHDQQSAHCHISELPTFISAKSVESLRSYCVALKSTLTRALEASGKDALFNIAYNLARKQNRALEYHWTSTTSSLTDFSNQLDAASQGSQEFTRTTIRSRPVVLCFSGQTGNTVTLSKDLFESSKLFQNHLIECDSTCRMLGLPSLFPRIFQVSPVEDIVSLHCMLFSLQYASAKSWIDSGLEVDTLVGHSFGQLTALCVAGSLSLAGGLRLISNRARLIRDRWGPENGLMLSIEGELREVEKLLDLAIERTPSCAIDIACFNGPRSFVAAGNQASIENVERTLQSAGSAMNLKARRLKNTHAFHSRLVDGITSGLLEVARSLEFKKPSMHVETCTKGQSWSEVDAGKIVQHTREPVYFHDAIERIAGRLQSAIWLEASSNGPIIPMIRRILTVGSSTEHIFQSVDFGGSNALSNLAKITRDLWLAGSRAQFWPFQRSEEHADARVNLPPYQFERIRHWLELKTRAEPNGEVTVPSPKKQLDLLQRVEDHEGDSDEALFSIDSTNSTYRHLAQGHAVLDHGLSPASMYFEMAVRGARSLFGPESSKRTPHIQELKISTPIGLNPAGSLFLLLSKDQTTNDKWRFEFFSRGQQDGLGSVMHATGVITLLSFRTSLAASRFRSLRRLVKSSRCKQISNSLDSNGLLGPAVYEAFRKVVNYADYYRGVKRIFAQDGEVVGYVSTPQAQPPDPISGDCDPIAIDNFLQVAGIHVNCLSGRKEDEVFMCTAIGGLLMSDDFMKSKTTQRSWTVYSNYEPSNKNRVGNDIFVLDSDSEELVLTIMDAQFVGVPFETLSKTLSKLDEARQATPLIETESKEELAPVNDSFDTPETTDSDQSPDASSVSKDSQLDQDQTVEKVRRLFSEILEIPTNEIQTESAMEDLGVDSLMITEVLSEIKQAFNVVISVAKFQDFRTVQSLCDHLQLSSSTTPLSRDHLQPSSSTTPLSVLSPSSASVLSPSSASISMPATSDPSSSRTSVSSSPRSFEKPDDYISHKRTAENFASLAYESFTNKKCNYDSIAEKTNFIGFCDSVYPDQAELVVAYVVEAFTALGCPIASLNPDQHLPDINYSPKHSKVVKQLYKILQDAKLITGAAGNFCRTNKDTPKASAQVLQAALIKKFPQHTSEHELLHKTGQQLADCLTERADPLGILFRDAHARILMTDVYTNAPMFKTGTVLLAEYLVDIFRNVNDGREIRVLELGAGTGGTTSYLMEKLVGCGQNFRYTFTDLSSSLVVAAKKKFRNYDFMEYAVVDIEQTPSPQNLGQYDIIISTNCIHATKNLALSGTNIRKMLRPDGILCLVELTQNLFWFDLVFGLLEGWWLFNDGREHVLANEHRWQQSLQRAGFKWVDWSQGNSSESRILRVITASASEAIPSPSKALPTNLGDHQPTQETVIFKEENGAKLHADIYYPEHISNSNATLPVGMESLHEQ